MLGRNALVASGSELPTGPSLSLNLPNAHAEDMARYGLISRMTDMPFGRSTGYQTWEDPAAVLTLLTSAEVGGSVIMKYETNWDVVYGVETSTWYAAFVSSHGWWELHVVSSGEEVASKLVNAVRKVAGDPASPGPDEVSMAVWAESPMGGGMARYSTMHVGAWGDVSQNYSAATRASLESLATKLPDPSEGGLIVMCGVPGSGKTRAIESLCHAWARDARLGVVVDSDRLLQSAAYLADVLTAADSKRQVIVAEDVDELVSVGRKSHEASKLLNVADGLVGRLAGAGTLFVLTANLALDEIADFVVRPGRAAAVIEFENFSQEEARLWLDSHGSTAEAHDDMNLASLYAAVKS